MDFTLRRASDIGRRTRRKWIIRLRFATGEETIKIRTSVRDLRGVSRRRLGTGFAQPGAVSAFDRDVHLDAQRLPDLGWADAARERLVRGAVAEGSEHEVARERSTVGLAELIAHGKPELAEFH